jgi:hypothetical protein
MKSLLEEVLLKEATRTNYCLHMEDAKIMVRGGAVMLRGPWTNSPLEDKVEVHQNIQIVDFK